jgi:hypothetical protein
MTDTVAKARADISARLSPIEVTLGLTVSFPKAVSKDTIAKLRADADIHITAVEEAMAKWCCQHATTSAPGPTAPPPSSSGSSGSTGSTGTSGTGSSSPVGAGVPEPVPEVPTGPTIIVSTTAELLDAIAACVGGETIKCSPGTYSGIGTIDGRAFTIPVTITRTGVGGVVFPNFNISNCRGLTLKQIDFGANPGLWSWRITDSSAITLAGVHAYPLPGFDPLDPPLGLLITRGEQIAITGCEFSALDTALSISGVNGLTVSGNHFHDLRADASDITQSSNVTVTGNYVHDLYIVEGDHPDAFQFWTTSATDPMVNVRVTGNLIWRGTRPDAAHLQGIFFNTDMAPFRTVTIHDNLIVGPGFNALTVMSAPGSPPVADRPAASDVTITGNAIYTFPGDGAYIRVEHVTVGTVTGNLAGEILADVGNAALTVQAPTISPPVTDGGAAVIAAWLASHPEMAWINDL